MKTLLKIALVFVFALFVSMSVKAQNDVTTGTINVNVPAFLKLTVTSPAVNFIYDQYGTGSDKIDGTWVDIQANIPWQFGVKANGPLLNGSASIALSKITYTHALCLGASTPVTLTASNNYLAGSMDSQGSINWVFDTTGIGNLGAGNYTANLTYSLIQ